MIIVTFALPQESRDLVRALRDCRRFRTGSPAPRLPMARGRLGDVEVLIAHTGLGTASAAATLKSLISDERPRQVISAGFAGGLDPALTLGALVVATNYSSPELCAAICRGDAQAHRLRFGALTTQPSAVESVAEKARVARETGAIATDMETAAIVEACRHASTPLLSVRSISDTADQRLPVPLAHWFDLQRQRPRPFALAAYLARHPARIPEFARFIAALPMSRASLTRFLVGFLKKDERSESMRERPTVRD